MANVDSTLFKLLRQGGIAHKTAFALAQYGGAYRLGGRAPATKYVQAITATDGDVLLVDASSRTVADGVTTSGSKTVTSATAAFTATDVGRAISGTGIPAAATIAAVNSATSVTISANATASGTGVSVTIGGAVTVTPPAASAGMRLTVKKIDAGANTVTIDPPGAVTVDGAATKVLANQYDSCRLVSDGTNWFVV